MSRGTTSFVMGFHGCDRAVGERALAGDMDLPASDQDFDWLGPGVYFWEKDPRRALEWAQVKATLGRVKDPFVIGAVIDLGNCLDLTLRENLDILADAHKGLVQSFRGAGKPVPRNQDGRKGPKGDKLLRFLDCAVIRYVHASVADAPALRYDTVRGMFLEGKAVYPGARFYHQTHTQIAVVSPKVIRGLFRVRDF
jgi:hypothetical protein